MARLQRSPNPHLSKIPWELIVGMRNRLVLVYFDINFDLVWQTVREDLPELIPALLRKPDSLPEGK